MSNMKRDELGGLQTEPTIGTVLQHLNQKRRSYKLRREWHTHAERNRRVSPYR